MPAIRTRQKERLSFLLLANREMMCEDMETQKLSLFTPGCLYTVLAPVHIPLTLRRASHRIKAVFSG